MPYLKPRPRPGAAWLPGQVAYGIDCSDQDPKNWKAFGELAEQEKSKGGKPAPDFGTNKPS